MGQPSGNLAGTNQNSGLIGGVGDFWNNLKQKASGFFPALQQLGAQTDATAQSQANEQRVQGLLKARINQGNIQPGFANTPVGSIFGRAPGGQGNAPAPKTASITQPTGGNNQSAPVVPPPVVPNPNGVQPYSSLPGYDANGKIILPLQNNQNQSATAPGTAGNTGEVSGAAGQAYLNNLQNLKDNSQYDPATGNYIPAGGTNNPPLNATVGGLLPGLLNTNNNPLLNKIVLQEQQQIGDTLTGQPGQPQDLAQGRAGLIQNTANAAIANAIQEQQLQQNAYGTALGAVAPQTPSPFGVYQPGTNQFTQYGGGQGNGIGSAAQATGNYSSGQNYYANMLPNYKAAENDLGAFKDWLNTPANQGGGQGVNFSQLNIGNKLQAWLQGQNFSDPRFPELNTFLNDFTNKLSSVVGANSNQITNYKQQLVNSMLDPTATPDSILQQANTLMNVAQQSLKGVYDTFTAPSGSGNPNTFQSYGGGNQANGQSTSNTNPNQW